MVIIRPTGRIAKRKKVKLSSNEQLSSTTLGDWYALDLVIERRQYILCTNEKGRLSVILHAAPYAEFHRRISKAVADVLREIGVSDEKTAADISKMTDLVLAKTTNRSVLGSMNEFRFMLQAHSQRGRFRHEKLFKMSLCLADTISLILPEATPAEEVLKLFSEPPKAPSLRFRWSMI